MERMEPVVKQGELIIVHYGYYSSKYIAIVGKAKRDLSQDEVSCWYTTARQQATDDFWSDEQNLLIEIVKQDVEPIEWKSVNYNPYESHPTAEIY